MKRYMKVSALFLLMICAGSLISINSDAQNSPKVQQYLDSVRPYINNYRQTDPIGVLGVLYKMEKMNQDSILMGRIYMAIITTSNQVGQYQVASEYLLKHRRLSQKLDNLLYLFYNYSNSGLLFFNTGDYDSAMLYYRKTLTSAELLQKSKAVVKVNIGMLYETIGDPNGALEYYTSSLLEAYDSLRYPHSNDIFYTKETTRVVTTAASSLLMYSTLIGDDNKAQLGRAYLDSLFTHYKSEIVGTNLLVIHNTLGGVELEKVNLSLAKEHAYQLLSLSKEIGNDFYKHHAVDLLAQISLNSRGQVVDYETANKLMWEIGDDLRQQDRITFYLLRSLLLMRLSVIDSAMFYHDKYAVLKKFDGQVINDVKRRIDGMFSNVDLSRKYQTEIEQMEVISKKEDADFYTVLIVSLVLIGTATFIILYYFGWKRRRVVNE